MAFPRADGHRPRARADGVPKRRLLVVLVVDFHVGIGA